MAHRILEANPGKRKTVAVMKFFERSSGGVK
jgi:hypothetical protein